MIISISWFQACTNPFWVGDGFCDDATNNEVCNYDGGDCCLSDVMTTYCIECLCLEGGNSTTTTTSPHEGNIKFISLDFNFKDWRSYHLKVQYTCAHNRNNNLTNCIHDACD